MIKIKIKRHRGIGDTVEAVTRLTGVQKIVKAGAKALNKPCGCDERQEKLNKLFPYGKK